MRMGADAGAVHRDDPPFQLARSVGVALERLEHPLPDALAPPAQEAVVAGVPRAVAFGQIAPARAGAQHPENAVEHLAMILILAAALSLGGGQQGRQAFVFLICQVCAFHSGIYLPT